MHKFIVTLTVSLDLSVFNQEDAYESVHAFADCLRSGDFDGLRHLSEVVRIRPHFLLNNVQQFKKPPESPTVDNLFASEPAAQ